MREALRDIWLVASRDFTQRARSKGFVVSTLIVMLFVGAIVAVPGLANRDPQLRYELGLVGRVESRLGEVLRLALQESEGRIDITTTLFETRAAADRALRRGAVDALLVDSERLVFEDGEVEDLSLVVNRAVYSSRLPDELAALGITVEQAHGLLNQQVLTVESLAGGPLGEDEDAAARSAREGRRWMAFAGGWLLMISITTYGQWVLLGVIEEKTSKVGEVLLATLPAHHLIAGKVLGVGLVGLLQLSLIVMVVAAEMPLTEGFEVPDGAFAIAGSVALWFVLGFALYAVGFAVAGATVGRQEDAQYGSLPVILVLLVSYALATAVSVAGLGGERWVQIASYLPPLAPMLMPTRAALGHVQAWEFVPAVLLMLLAIYSLLRLGGRIYAGGQLQSGPRLRLREAWRMLRG
ncbi:MAG: ABC transporter permease [Dehalococcoidia bacterium]